MDLIGHEELPDGLFDESIFESLMTLDQEIENLRQSFDILDAAGGDSNNCNNDDDDDFSSGGDDDSFDDDSSDYDNDYDDDEDPESGETKLSSMMDDLVEELQMELKEEAATEVLGDKDDDENQNNDTVQPTFPASLLPSSSGEVVPSYALPNTPPSGPSKSSSNLPVRLPEDREKGILLHQHVRSLLRRVTDMATISEKDDSFQPEMKQDNYEEASNQEVNMSQSYERRKRSDSSAEQIKRLLGAIESYSQSRTPSPSHRSTNSVNVPVNNHGSVPSEHVSDESDDDASQIKSDKAKTARAMSNLTQRKRREYLLRRQALDDEEDNRPPNPQPQIPVPVAAAPTHSQTASTSIEQRQQQEHQQRLQQQRRRQEELLQRRARLLRQQQVLQQKEQLLLEQQRLVQHGQNQEPSQTTTSSQNKKKKGRRKRTNKHKKRRPKVTPVEVDSPGRRMAGNNTATLNSSQQAASVSRKTLEALYAKLLALDERLTQEYGDCNNDSSVPS